MNDNKQLFSVNTKIISEAMGVSRNWITRKAKKEQWPHAHQKINGANAYVFDLWELPSEVREAVIDYLQAQGVSNRTILGTSEPESLEDDPDWIAARALGLPEIPQPLQVSHEEVEELEEQMMRSKSKAARDKARKRGQVCRDVLKLMRQGYNRTEAINQLAGKGQSVRAINDWLATVKGQQSHYFDALLFKDYPTEKPPKADWTKAKMKVCDLHFRPEKPSYAASYGYLVDFAEANNWYIPGFKTVYRFLKGEENKPHWYIARHGEEAFLQKLPHMKRTKDHLKALDIVEADGHKMDLNVHLPSGKIGRPVLIAWMDEKSCKILSWRLAETENQHVIRESFSEVLKIYGIPKEVYIDNGRAFANKAMSGQLKHRYRFKKNTEEMEGLFVRTGVEVTWARPGHGQSKTIEGAWSAMNKWITKHPDAAGAYTGNNPMNKPANYGKRVLEWDKLLEIIDQGIIRYNSELGRKGEGMNGRSFDQVFEASQPPSIRKATKSQLQEWALMAKQVKVSKTRGYIGIGTRKYWPKEALGLSEYEGKEIVVRYDHRNPLADVYFETLNGTSIGMGYTKESPFGDPKGAEEIEGLRGSKLKSGKQTLKAERQALASEEIKPMAKRKAAPLPEHQIIAHDFKNNKTKRRAQEPESEEESGYTDFDRTMLTIMKAKRAL